MCTAVSFKNYFGRNLDYECSYGEQIAIAPRNFDFNYRFIIDNSSHYAIIGMAHMVGDYPLYYDAVNEKGLGMAGLNFVGNARFNDIMRKKKNVAAFEFIPWILSRCETTSDAKDLLKETNVVAAPFDENYPVAQLHYMISDKDSSIVVECTKDGMKVYDDPVSVLTNNPPFDMQLFKLNDYMYLSEKQPENSFSEEIPLSGYSRGMGALGLPGDLSSSSRFIKAAFIRAKSHYTGKSSEDISQFFHIMASIEQQKGACEVREGEYEYTIYSSCCDLSNGVYYYKTYDNHRITGVDMFNEELDGTSVITYPMIDESLPLMQNR